MLVLQTLCKNGHFFNSKTKYSFNVIKDLHLFFYRQVEKLNYKLGRIWGISFL